MPLFHGSSIGRGLVLLTPNAAGSDNQIMVLQSDLKTLAFENQSGGGGLPVDDTTSIVRDPVDNTKQMRIDVGAVATATTRILTMPDRDVDLSAGGTFAEASHTHTESDITDLQAYLLASSIDTLAKLNAIVTDATLDTNTASRPPNGAAGGDLGGTYPNPTVSDGADGTAIHDNVSGEIAAITESMSANATDCLLIESSAVGNAKRKLQVSNLESGIFPVSDNLELVDGGSTRRMRIDVGAVAVVTTRVLFMGDRDVDLAAGGTFAELSHTHTESDITDLQSYYVPGGTDVALADGGTGASLVDPNADRIMFWDDSAGAVTWLTVGSGLTITDTTLTASGGGLPVDDTTAIVQDPVDNTKRMRIDVGAVTTATTRVLTMPDRDVDLSSGGTFAEAVHTHTESDITDLGSYLENIVEDTTPQLGGDLDVQGNHVHFDETTSTPTGTTQGIDLTNGNHQTLDVGSASGALTVTFTAPTDASAGDLVVIQDAAPKDITWAVTGGSIVWLGTEPTWSGDTSKTRIVSWRWRPANTTLYLMASATN